MAAGLGPPLEHALISLLALNGLRVSEATGADIEHLGLERGHRTLTITRKGGKVVTIPLAPRTARAIDLAVGERTDGPVFLAADGRRLDRHGAGRIVRKAARRAGIGKAVTPHTLRHVHHRRSLDAGVPLRDVQEAASHADPRTTIQSARGPAWTGTPPISSPPLSPAPPDKHQTACASSAWPDPSGQAEADSRRSARRVSLPIGVPSRCGFVSPDRARSGNSARRGRMGW